MIQLPPEFGRLLNSLNDQRVEYLVVGGYAVIFHGYVRTTGDLDIWISTNAANASKVEAAVRAMGFNMPWLKADLFLKREGVLRIGVEPFRFEIINHISGVEFDACMSRCVHAQIDDIRVPVISLKDLKTNKKAAGRHKDLADLENLP